MPAISYPAGLGELQFVESYLKSILRKPQVAADAALRTLVLAAAADRVMLTALIAEQLAESGRRLLAVHGALADRTYAVARSLLGPLPGVAAWAEFEQLAGTLDPEQMTRRLGLGDSALESARRLRAQSDLSLVTPLIQAAEAGGFMSLVPVSESRRAPVEFWVASTSREGEAVSFPFGALEADAASLADLTADLSSIACGFLGAYLEARRGAGRKD